MKNSFILNEEERKRILNLHESAIKKEHLTEVVVALTPLAIPGAIAVGAVSYFNSLGSSSQGVKKMFEGCKTQQMGEKTLDDSTLDEITDGIFDAIDGAGTKLDQVKSNLSRIPTIPDLCAVTGRYTENHPGRYLFNDLDGDINFDGEWNTYVYRPLLSAVRKSTSLGNQASQQGTIPAGWEKFSCVPSNSTAKQVKYGNSFAYLINGVYYYSNGRKKLEDGTMANYTCNDPEFSGSTDKSSARMSPKDYYQNMDKYKNKQVNVNKQGNVNKKATQQPKQDLDFAAFLNS